MNTQEQKSVNDAIATAYATFANTDTGAQLRPVRDRAFEIFARTGFPTGRDENWKYTNLTDVESRSTAYLGAATIAADDDAIRGILLGLPIRPEHYTIVFANGTYREDLSQLPKGVSDLSLETLRGADEQLAAGLGRIAELEAFQLAALNTAFLNDALLIRVPANCTIDQPVHAVFVSDGQHVGVQARILVEVETRGQLTLVEHHVGDGDSLTNAVTEISCAEGAQVRFIKIQEAGPDAYHLATQFVELERDAHFDAVHLDFGALLARNDLNVRLVGSGASAQLHGLFVVDGQRHIDNHTRVDHLTASTTSRESFRGIIDDQARGVFNGKIIVHPGADQTDAQLNNRNLLLSPRAEIDTKPELEIYTDDVKCSHGTTTGQLDTDSLFYLRSRGVPEDEARRMLVTAFAAEVVERLIDLLGEAGAAFAEHAKKTLAARLPG
jgi:Fe-S cluster assembly protein SufD